MFKKTFWLLVLVPIIGIFPTFLLEYSYAQNTDLSQITSTDSGIVIFVQTIVKNSEGQVVTYLTSYQFTFLDLDALETLLNSEISENDPIITNDGIKFQVIKRQRTVTHDKEDVIASTLLAHNIDDKQKIVARFAHDGFPISPGDKVTSIWTFIKPIG